MLDCAGGCNLALSEINSALLRWSARARTCAAKRPSRAKIILWHPESKEIAGTPWNRACAMGAGGEAVQERAVNR